VNTEHAREKYARIADRTAQVERRRAAAVQQLASERDRIGGMLAERKRLLASVQGEVVKLKAEEAQRQARLAALARARLARQEAAARAAARARARAAAAAAAQQKARAATTPDPAPATTTTVATAPDATAAPTTTAAADPAPAPTADPAPAPTPAPTPTIVPSAPLGAGHPEAASIAMRYLGVPYVWGGGTPAGFDCSGLVMYVYAQLGILLPHFAAAQYGFGTPVPRDQLQPGDLVFFDGLNHVGIYIGGGQMIHAPHTGDVVKISPLSEFGASYVGARRI
jgi:cell wall-associated NlpC family hydrolase